MQGWLLGWFVVPGCSGLVLGCCVSVFGIWFGVGGCVGGVLDGVSLLWCF